MLPDELTEAAYDVFESVARWEEVKLVLGVEEGSQRRQHDGTHVQIPDLRPAMYHLQKSGLEPCIICRNVD